MASLNLHLCSHVAPSVEEVDCAISDADALAVGDPMSCAVAILVVESPPRYV